MILISTVLNPHPPASVALPKIVLRLFTDELFNGKKAEISFYGENHTGGGIYKINLKNITRDYYLYLKSHTLQFENIDNPFAEPVQVYHNVNNGFGILGDGTGNKGIGPKNGNGDGGGDGNGQTGDKGKGKGGRP